MKFEDKVERAIPKAVIVVMIVFVTLIGLRATWDICLCMFGDTCK